MLQSMTGNASYYWTQSLCYLQAKQAMNVALLILVPWICSALAFPVPKDLGLQINESLQGFFSEGSLPFAVAYEEGKKANRTWNFTCAITVEHMKQFVSNVSHTAGCVGKIFITGLTDAPGTDLQDATMQLFPGDLNDHQLQLVYSLQFTALSGAKYSLKAVKHIDGYRCLDLYQMFTQADATLYDGNPAENNKLATGKVIVPAAELGPFFRSMRVIGDGTDADKLDVVVEFISLLARDISSDCLNSSNSASQFWYVWASDGTNGMLLDLIERPSELELRLETYSVAARPVVTKRFLALEDLHQTAPDNLTMGPVTLSLVAVRGLINDIALDLTYAVNNGSNHFIPANLLNASDGLLPDIFSRYGALSGGMVAGHPYATGTPLTFTTYTFKIGLKWACWAMISAMKWMRAGTNTPVDLRVEVVAMVITQNYTLATSYVRLMGQEYHNNQSFAATTMTAIGALDRNETRWFGARIRTGGLQLDIQCSAPAKQFALLDQELLTEIHTTVLGDCGATELLSQQRYDCKNCALLETKQFAL
eukprot:TRINITY_DN11901_c0_g1_i1.p2 TRINITY_DN11901_c0_g1~~TRINITY_DN11901_c0_g1_i1.p2  ORF type:complete len:537 (+),score=101.31 TRINITY_DN11901_c0_g1_i1:1922-3532(+)